MLTFTFSSLIRRVVFACCVLALPSLAVAQQTGGTNGTGSGTGATGGPAATEAAAADAGQQLSNQNLFSATEEGAGVGQHPLQFGRFATNQFQNAPTASGTEANAAQGGRTTTNRFGGNQNTRRGNTQNRFGGNTRSRQTIRPALRLGFVPPPRPSADVTRSVERRFNTLSARTARLADTVPAFRGVTIKVGNAGRVTLPGEVGTPQAARLAANILRMEAGVRSVQNDLIVAEK